ncbi:MAG: MBL fold metallo-hydrolase [Bacteroidota bacterium]|nr:MBL fold metallo-hydrolase [Bacteroidota bacterium]
MKLVTLDTGRFKLDGGAMFGVVPKSLWNKKNPADENNMCDWALRCLLIEDRNHLIVIDSGIGNKQDDKFYSYYHLSQTKSIADLLAESGYSVNDVTHHIITHLHFDHCGGSIVMNENGEYVPVFPNAQYIISSQQWSLANEPNPREKASFISNNITPLAKAKELTMITQDSKLSDRISFKLVNGHTSGMIIPHILVEEKTIVFAADLFPSHWHLTMPWVMAYDTQPLVTLKEKEHHLKIAVRDNYYLFYEHDPIMELSNVIQKEKGINVGESYKLTELLS